MISDTSDPSKAVTSAKSPEPKAPGPKAVVVKLAPKAHRKRSDSAKGKPPAPALKEVKPAVKSAIPSPKDKDDSAKCKSPVRRERHDRERRDTHRGSNYFPTPPSRHDRMDERRDSRRRERESSRRGSLFSPNFPIFF